MHYFCIQFLKHFCGRGTAPSPDPSLYRFAPLRAKFLDPSLLMALMARATSRFSSGDQNRNTSQKLLFYLLQKI